MKVENTVAVVTGSSSGEGAEAAIKLAALEAKVVVNYVNSNDCADQTLARLKELGGEGVSVRTDVADSLISVIQGSDLMTGQIISFDGGITIN
ncbi:MAG: SDR family NAD(P)-dependent oxidoreductase [Pseudomonadota bacterium]